MFGGKKRSSMKLAIIFGIMLLLLPLFFKLPMVDTYTQEILPGHYLTTYNTKSCTRVTSNWTVISGDPLDVYLLTQSQYNSWNHSFLPSSSLFMELGSINGFLNVSLNASDTYYVVFSNINGSVASTVEIVTYFYNCRTRLNLPLLVIGVLVLTCQLLVLTVYFLRRGPSEPKGKPPLSHGKFYLLFFVVGAIVLFILNLLLDDFLLALLIGLNVLLPLYAVLFFKYYRTR